MTKFFRDMLLAGGELGRRRFWIEGHGRYIESEEVRSWQDSNRPLSTEEQRILARLRLEDRQRGGL